MLEKKITKNYDETILLGKKLVSVLNPGSVIALSGPLGSGKTVLAKGIAEGLDITEIILSPTFTLISEYNGRFPLYHMDLYRLSGSEEFEVIGGYELLFGNGISIIEWSEKISNILPDNTIYINIQILKDNSRLFTMKNPGAKLRGIFVL